MRSFAIVAAMLLAPLLLAGGADAQARERLPKAAAPVIAANPATPSRLWHYVHTGEGPVLRFGSPREDQSTLAFSCAAGSNVVRIVAYADAKTMLRGDAARLLLSNGKARLEIAGTAFADPKAQRLAVGGTSRGAAQFLEVFRGETLIVELPGRKAGAIQKTSLPLKTLGTKAAQFAALCSGKG